MKHVQFDKGLGYKHVDKVCVKHFLYVKIRKMVQSLGVISDKFNKLGFCINGN